MKIFCLTNQDQIDLLSSYITLNFNFSENLKIDIDKLIAKQDQSTDNLATQRIVFFDLVKKSLSTMQIDEFTNSLSESNQRILNLANLPSANLDSRNNNPNNFYNSYLAIKNAANDSEIRRLFESREFVSRLAINDTVRNSESDIILMQSILMHNPSALEHLKSLELDEEHDLKRQQIIKNVAIASLVNPNLHAKAKIILQDFSPEKFDDFDFENIQKSLLFLCAGIKYSAYKQSEDTLKFDILKKVLPFYHEKFDQRLNIQFRLPSEIIDALKLSIKSFSFKIDEERASSIPIDHDQYHKLFCGSDAIIEVNKAMILKALSRKDETIDPESSISPTNHYPVITNPVVQQMASPRQPSSTIYSSRRTENDGNPLRASTRNYRCVIS